MTTSTNPATWELLPVVTNARGSKSAPITCQGGAIKIKMEPTRAPFGAGNFNKEDTVRVNLDLACTESYIEFLKQVDAWVIDRLVAHSKTVFKKEMSKDEIKGIYRPSYTAHSKAGIEYMPTMRTKINTCGPNAVKCWTAEKTPRDLPQDWRNCTITPEVLVKSVWLMNGGCGTLFEIKNAIVEEASDECPF
jgi:hypothetical protein